MLAISNNNLHTSPNFKGLPIGPKAAKALNKVGAIKSPGQRLAFGVAALALQPAIDRFNPWVDEDTRKKSAARSAAKAIACTATGVVIREACILGTNALLGNNKIASKFPSYMTKDKGHASAVIGTLMGLGIMMFTNFLIDVPLTNKLDKIFSKKAGIDKDTPQEQAKISTPPLSAPQTNATAETFSKNQNTEAIHDIAEKIDKGELPPMSQVNMEVIKWA